MAESNTRARVSSQDWEQVIADFRGSPESRGKWISVYGAPGLLDQALQVAMATPKKESLRLQVLAFLEENASILLGNADASDGYSLLIEALKSTMQACSGNAAAEGPSAATVAAAWALKEQMLITVTSAMVSSDVLRNSLKSLEVLVELLLNFINRPNHSADRQLRSTACECLRELELAYPCLLHAAAGHLLALCQSERTHAAQSYTLLLTSILRNAALNMDILKANGYSILSTSTPLVPFTVSSFLLQQTSSQQGRSACSDETVREFRRALSFLLERPNLLTDCALADFISDLSDIASSLDLQPGLLKLQFWNLLHSCSPVACHSLLTIFTRFQETFDGEELGIYKRLVRFQPHLTMQLLALHWMRGMEELFISRHKEPVLPLVIKSLYPQVFDPLCLKAAKLECFALCAAALDASAEAVKLFYDGLMCLSSYRWLPTHSLETRLLFHVLHRFLVANLPHSESVKEDFHTQLFRTLEETLVAMGRDVRRLVNRMLELLDRLLGCEVHHQLGSRILRTFSEDLIPSLPKNLHLPAYFYLMERIAEDESIPPSALIQALHSYVEHRIAASTENENARLWQRGSEVLGICRILLMHHRSSRIFRSLSSLLGFMCHSFPDIEVRDSARFYLRLLVCLPGGRVRKILKYGDDGMEDSQPSLHHVSSLLSSVSPRALKRAKQAGQIASYLQLVREQPLLVRNSWSLVVHESFQPILETFPVPTTGSSSKSEGTAPADEEDVAFSTREEVQHLDSSLGELRRVMDAKTADILNVLREHFQQVPESGLKVQVLCRLKLKIEEDDSSDPPGIYAVVISFSTTASYAEIPAVRIPFVLSSSPPERVRIDLEPRQPAPALVDCQAVFSDEDAQTVRGQLDSIPVGIEDLFMTAPVPAREQQAAAEYLFNLFNALWFGCSGPGKLGSELFRLKGGRKGVGIRGSESVKLLEAQADRVVAAVQKFLAGFIVCISGSTLSDMVKDNRELQQVHKVCCEQVEEEQAKVEELRPATAAEEFSKELIEVDVSEERERGELGCFMVLIFLPPMYHLLLRMEVSDWSTLVRIRTDYWPSLAYIDEYLESLVAPRTGS